MAKLDTLKQTYNEKSMQYNLLLDEKNSRIHAIEKMRDEAIEDYKKVSPRPECQLSEKKYNTIHKKYTNAKFKLEFRYKRSLGKIFITSLIIAVITYVFFAITSALDFDIFEDSTEGQIAQIIASLIIPFFIFTISAIKRSSAKSTMKKCLRIKEYADYRNAVDAWAVKIDEISKEASEKIKAHQAKIDNLKLELGMLETDIYIEQQKEETPVKQNIAKQDTSTSAQIIILGDDPGLSTGAVGYITFDNGKELLVPYSDYPQSYAVPSGKHHVLITADPKSSPGYYVTAKLDREIDFGLSNILWVDIRTTYTKTEINWKLITQAVFESEIPSQARDSIIKKGNIL